MAYGTRAAFEAVREVAFGSLTGSYAAVGTATTDHARMIRIVSTLNTEAYISFDGSTNHIRLAAGSFVLYDFTANRVQDDGLFLSEGTTIYAKYSTAPSSGNIWIEVAYAQGGV